MPSCTIWTIWILNAIIRLLGACNHKFNPSILSDGNRCYDQFVNGANLEGFIGANPCSSSSLVASAAFLGGALTPHAPTRSCWVVVLTSSLARSRRTWKRWRGKGVKGETISKHIVTLMLTRLIASWAISLLTCSRRSCFKKPSSLGHNGLPKAKGSRRFQDVLVPGRIDGHILITYF